MTQQSNHHNDEEIVVRAIDVGYGNIKLTLDHPTTASDIECDIFPSRSPTASGRSLSAGLLKSRDTVTIKVGNTEFEVGHDVSLAQPAYDEGAALDKGFCLSDAYLARLRGALYYMKGTNRKNGAPYISTNRIGILVVGLPVSTYQDSSLRLKLEAKLKGEHPLPHGRTVHVERVRVVPQPLGTFFDFSFKGNKYDQMKKQMNLIIDPGFFTFDWLLISSGLIPVDTRSGAVNRGMSGVLKMIAENINKQEKLDTDTSMLVRMLDDHFRTNEPFAPFGKVTDVTPYLHLGRSVAQEAVAAMTNTVGNGADIQNILLAGGGAAFYLEAIREKFPRHNIITVDDPVFSNVRGFQVAGEQWAKGIQSRVRKDA